MSIHFQIKKNRDITIGEILEHPGMQKVQIAYGEELKPEEAFAFYCTFYMPYESSRGVTAGLDEHGFDVGINVLASKADYRLALRLSTAIAHLTGSEIEPEFGGSYSAEEFEKTFGEEWVEENKTQGLHAMTHIVNEQGIMAMSGCFRNYYLGPDMLKKMKEDEPDEKTLYQRVTDNIKKLQFLDPTKIYAPNMYAVTEDDGTEWSYIPIAPEARQGLFKAEYFMLFLDEDNHVRVPFDTMKEYALTHFERLDEEQFVFPKMSRRTFFSLMEHFGYQIQDGNSVKPWWKFW